SDGFIALPGGLGTIEEFFEALTWAQLGIHRKPCGLLNAGHYYDAMIHFLNHAVSQQFIEPEHRDMILISEDPETLIEQFITYQPPQVDKAGWALRMSRPPSAG
ncbi:MAG: LOG family protein, partial [Chloroflexi bacterium]|nr:LOG family protein [Chloroflexota bacterium]